MSSQEEKIKVLKLWVSPYANRVLMALEELGVEYDTQEEDLNNKSPELLQANPIYKTVPTIIHNGKPLSESLIILEYIHDTYSSFSTLLPTDPYEKAIARFWADFIDNKFWMAGYTVIVTDGESQEVAKKEFIDSFLLIEEAIPKISGGKPYFGGDKFGYLDIVLVPYVFLWHSVEIFGEFSIPLEKCPHLSAWIELVSKRESVVKILPTVEAAHEWFTRSRKKALSRSN
ncbi:hypothetical protein SUGI_0773110 [Cryptomeria japonica]|uniref:glutathione S-transferase U19 n=1 Tax=Cryptomeria japonica TaxID=3369 RepID=UPI0024149CA0|nr:glutathione S-transferase U19 [Cryptomeria japonica]GLJ37980.1 hypothetical protein SUGI_0773110 [Cryptomeria japonica]